MPPIATVTLNPALDLTAHVRGLEVGGVNRAKGSDMRAGGKGVNVAIVLHDLGEPPAVAGILGRENTAAFDALFEERGWRNGFVYEAGATRTNIKVSEDGGRSTDINLPGFDVSESVRAELARKIEALCEDCDWFLLCGSLPSGVTAEAFAGICRLLKEKGKNFAIDTSAQALAAGISAGPAFVKPNVDELEQYAGKPLASRGEQETVIRDILAQGVEHVILSEGSKGSRWYSRGGSFEAAPLPVSVVSTVGAGDSMVAAIAFGLSRGLSVEETFRTAAAAAAIAVGQVGVGVQSKRHLDELIAEVDIRPLPFSS
ncbi:1-phosphofructokinase [Diplonema papillatum]|nr:1-phosphofructokinase [Diplonema papillatum]|eukprot:gene17066-26181_t